MFFTRNTRKFASIDVKKNILYESLIKRILYNNWFFTANRIKFRTKKEKNRKLFSSFLHRIVLSLLFGPYSWRFCLVTIKIIIDDIFVDWQICRRFCLRFLHIIIFVSFHFRSIRFMWRILPIVGPVRRRSRMTNSDVIQFVVIDSGSYELRRLKG